MILSLKGGWQGRREIKMVEEKDTELTSLHEHIKNPSKCGATLADNRLVKSRKALL